MKTSVPTLKLPRPTMLTLVVSAIYVWSLNAAVSMNDAPRSGVANPDGIDRRSLLSASFQQTSQIIHHRFRQNDDSSGTASSSLSSSMSSSISLDSSVSSISSISSSSSDSSDTDTDPDSSGIYIHYGFDNAIIWILIQHRHRSLSKIHKIHKNVIFST